MCATNFLKWMKFRVSLKRLYTIEERKKYLNNNKYKNEKKSLYDTELHCTRFRHQSKAKQQEDKKIQVFFSMCQHPSNQKPHRTFIHLCRNFFSALVLLLVVVVVVVVVHYSNKIISFLQICEVWSGQVIWECVCVRTYKDERVRLQVNGRRNFYFFIIILFIRLLGKWMQIINYKMMRMLIPG